MEIHQIVPILAAIGFVVYAVTLALRGGKSPMTFPVPVWLTALLLAGGFLAWSLGAVFLEGPTGFWPEHTRNLWGVQIWLDLLIAAGVALAFLVPEARRVGLAPLPWVLLTCVTGSFGLLVFSALVLLRRQGDSAGAG